MEVQRVMVIQDASKQVCSSAIRWALDGLLLKPGDLLLLLGVLHQVKNPSKLSFKGTRKFLGSRSKVESSSKYGDREAEWMEAYESKAQILELSKLYKEVKKLMRDHSRICQVEFQIQVVAGDSPAVVALKSVEDFNATWIILDRKMKKSKKIFMEKLSCGISRMKRNNSIELLRGPTIKFNKYGLTYEDMMPGLPEEEDLFSIELSPTYQAEAKQESQNQKLAHTGSSAYSRIGLQVGECLACTVCDNTRQNDEWRRDFSYVELHAATDGFSSKNKLSKDDGECTFRGQLENKLNIVIKPANNDIYFQEPTKFKSDIDVLKRVRHKNLVMMLGCCSEGNHRLLVHKYVCNGSLDQHLSKYHPLPLTWTERVRVALGAARGLNHLHQNNIIHRDIRSSNILLNHDYEPLLGYLGLPTMQADQYLKQENIQTDRFLAPECLENVTVSTQTDVYSFGVVLLELITGWKTTDEKLGQSDFITWARPLLKQRRYKELLDPRIGNSHDVFQLYRMAQLAQKCMSKNPKKRLPMDEVVSILEYIIESKASCLNEGHGLVKSFMQHNSVKKVEHESCYQDVKTHSRSRSFSAYVWACQNPANSSSDNWKVNIFRRAKSGNAAQLHYGEMLN